MKSLAYYMTLPFRLEISGRDDGKGYCASYPDIPACTAFGATVNEAIVNVDKVKQKWFEDAITANVDIPAPQNDIMQKPASSKKKKSTKPISPDEYAPIDTFFPADKPIHVAVYIRAKVVNNGLRSPLELQECLYRDIVGRHSNWELMGIYTDEGAGSSLRNRPQLDRLLCDCKTGTIDVIITKDSARITPVVSDCMRVVYQLARMRHPVAVYFESDKLLTLSSSKKQLTTTEGELHQ